MELLGSCRFPGLWAVGWLVCGSMGLQGPIAPYWLPSAILHLGLPDAELSFSVRLCALSQVLYGGPKVAC